MTQDRAPDDELARRCADVMWANDRASRALGMCLESVSPGRSRLSMRVVETMVNGHDLCHGGYVATLADSAFAFACNSYGEVTVAAGFDVTFLAPARLGDLLVADAVERSRRGRSGLYDVTVRRAALTDGAQGAAGGDGRDVVAEFRGRSRSLGRSILADDPADPSPGGLSDEQKEG